MEWILQLRKREKIKEGEREVEGMVEEEIKKIVTETIEEIIKRRKLEKESGER